MTSPRVSFSPKPQFSRFPRDDEVYVMKAFSRHAETCDSCYDPLETYRQGYALCPKGRLLAIDVADYLYVKNGRAHSTLDSEKHQTVQIEIPAECEAVRYLLKAIERGMRFSKPAPMQPVSYDRTYNVPARKVKTTAPRREYDSYGYVKHTPHRSRHHHHHAPQAMHYAQPATVVRVVPAAYAYYP